MEHQLGEAPPLQEQQQQQQQQQQQHIDQHQDDRMVVTDEERQWARDIKRAVNESDELEALSDFDYVQYAMVTRGNTEEALYRITGMQSFRKQYKIDNSAEQGVQCLHLVMMLLPRFLMHLDNCPDTNEGIMAWDTSVFYPEVILSPCTERGADYYWSIYISAYYYMCYCTQPNLASIRDGLTLLLDCGQVEWENFSVEFQGRMQGELRQFYPLKWKRILAYNTAVIANVGWSLFKQFMNPDMRRILQLGCQVSGEDPNMRLRELFVPSAPERAQVNILRRARDLLLTRAHNAQTFSL